ncbi:MAG: chitobiase/beta-hexosaminidase C-terminal domain-containing protein [Firmicutes bacterium]|nr:chitobiase/beta-hexosaminidase C-terminal domain-containing protein [Bacillota bacterium]
MKLKKLMSLFTAAAMTVSNFAALTVSADYTYEEKSMRNVYVRANDTESGNSTTVYMGDDAKVYLAVDDPNKGDYDETGTTDIEKHIQPQYDMNGYVVKFYYDPNYFELADSGTGYDLNYGVAADYIYEASDEDLDGDIDDFYIGEDPTFYVDSGSKNGDGGTETVGGITYNVAYITVLFTGSWLPQKADGNDSWYNICELPLTPLKTGTTQVFVETNAEVEDYGLTLLAKHVTDYPLTFDLNVVNNGYHTINIKNKLKPDAPTATPGPGEYENEVDVELVVDDEPDSEIYYSTDGGETYQVYTDPIHIDTNTTIICYTRRQDGTESQPATYEYTIRPSSPKLFWETTALNTSLVPDVYSDVNPYTVYVSDSGIYASSGKAIDDTNQVYYTYSTTVSTDLVTIDYGGTDAETDWVQVSKRDDLDLNKLYIDETRTVRLITINSNSEKSYVSTYYLGIKPADVVITPEGGEVDGRSVDVTLTTETEGATIYYTVDGSDPRVSGMIYTGTITVSKTTTVRAVAKYNGIYSDVTYETYIIEPTPDDAVDAYPPAGEYTDEVAVELTSPTGRDIYYTTDGSDPADETNPNRYLYDPENPIVLDEDTTITAVSYDPDTDTYGEPYTFTYTIKPSAPILSPESEQFVSIGEVAIYNPCPEKDYIVYYTTDGTDPRTSSTRIAITGDSAVETITAYTEINAVTYNPETDTYSDVVTETYDVISSRPAKPVITPDPGVYILENGSTDTYTAQFLPVQDGVTIYYTVAYASQGEYPKGDPNIGYYDETITYTAGDEIPLIGETIIKAVAVNAFGIRSDLGTFSYTITPDVPDIPPSAVLSEDLNPLRVVAVPGSTVTYTIGESNAGFTNTLTAPDDGVFYIDPATGQAYADEDLTTLLGEENTSYAMPTDKIELTISCEKDGVTSGENYSVYTISSSGDLAAPYADKDSGEYEEILDENGNLLSVSLYCITSGATIQYKTASETDWHDYDASEPIAINDDTVLNVRAEKDGEYSSIVSYVYIFVPPAPVITPVSGRYSDTLDVVISVPDGVPSDRNYTIYYRKATDSADVRYTGQAIEITESASLRAYIVEDDQTDDAKYSDSTAVYYIIDTTAAYGKVSVASPYDTRSVFYTSEIITTPYSNGIELVSNNSDATIMYYYTYTRTDGTTVYSASQLTYDTPIMVTSSMTGITITAWLVDSNGAEIADSRDTFTYRFVDTDTLGVPTTSLDESVEYPTGTTYTLINAYPDDDAIAIYYTTDGSDPTDPDNPNRILYNDGDLLTLTDNPTTINAAYVVSVDDDELYGDIGEYTFTVTDTVEETPTPTPTATTSATKKPSSGGGSSGGATRATATPTVSPTEEPEATEEPNIAGEHEAYISGYPDGSVRAENNISREEVSQIIFRIMEDDAKNDYVPTGEEYPDVAADRWSAPAVEYLSIKGIIHGYPDGNFIPDGEITRAEFCTLITYYLGLDASDAEVPFDDITDEHWGYGYVSALYNAGYITGYEDGTFRPDAQLSRAEAVTVFNLILGRTPLLEYLLTTDFNPFNDLEEDTWYFEKVLEASITHEYELNEDGYEEPWYLESDEEEEAEETDTEEETDTSEETDETDTSEETDETDTSEETDSTEETE